MKNRLLIAYTLEGKEHTFEAEVDAFRDLEHATRELQLHLMAQILDIQPHVITRVNVRDEVTA